MGPVEYVEALADFEAEGCPFDDAPFPGYDHPLVADGDYPAWPAQLMLTWVPTELAQPPFAEIEMSVHNGAFLKFSPMLEKEIAARFRSFGFEVRKDVALVQRASGYLTDAG